MNLPGYSLVPINGYFNWAQGLKLFGSMKDVTLLALNRSLRSGTQKVWVSPSRFAIDVLSSSGVVFTSAIASSVALAASARSHAPISDSRIKGTRANVRRDTTSYTRRQWRRVRLS
jgi:hypothetical protein